jgi:uncharacterized damage-inducible protein DinB
MSDDAPSPKQIAFSDIERELAVTRKVLAALPEKHFAWKPHEKSMSLGRLATHVGNLPDWARGALDDDGMDFSTAPRPPENIATSAELLRYFDEKAAGLRAAIQKFDMARWPATWTMRNAQQTITAQPRPIVFRIWCVNHLINHRAQLCLYLRLLNVPVPTVYFNTADDQTWMFE